MTEYAYGGYCKIGYITSESVLFSNHGIEDFFSLGTGGYSHS